MLISTKTATIILNYITMLWGNQSKNKIIYEISIKTMILTKGLVITNSIELLF